MALILNPQSSRHEVADYLELRALIDPDGVSSALQLITDVCLGGYDSAYEDMDDAERSTWQTEREALAQEALDETALRETVCTAAVYPFEVDAKSLKAKPEASKSLYAFLLLLSFLKGNAPAHAEGAKLFEEVSAAAAAAYLGCDRESERFVFGFPRRRGPADFISALKELCGKKLLDEGSAHIDEPKAPYQKDARLDVVVWKNFPDRRRGRVIVFGQCATGADWEDKAFALNPHNWREKWLTEPFLPSPQGAFFIPFTVDENEWKHILLDGGVLFERFRIASLAGSHLAREVSNAIATWNVAAMSAAAIRVSSVI